MFTGFKDDFGGSEMIDYGVDECQSYSINKGQLNLSGGDSFLIELEGEDD